MRLGALGLFRTAHRRFPFPPFGRRAFPSASPTLLPGLRAGAPDRHRLGRCNRSSPRRTGRTARLDGRRLNFRGRSLALQRAVECRTRPVRVTGRKLVRHRRHRTTGNRRGGPVPGLRYARQLHRKKLDHEVVGITNFAHHFVAALHRSHRKINAILQQELAKVQYVLFSHLSLSRFWLLSISKHRAIIGFSTIVSTVIWEKRSIPRRERSRFAGALRLEAGGWRREVLEPAGQAAADYDAGQCL